LRNSKPSNTPTPTMKESSVTISNIRIL
jgi:hypothetical protein